MNRINLLVVKALLFSSCIFTLPMSAETDINIELTNGYRQDSFTTRLESFSAPGDLIQVDELKAHNLAFYQLGGKGRINISGWLTRVEGDYGWGSNGHFSENFSSVSITPNSLNVISATLYKGHIKEATSSNFKVGGGYLFLMDDYIDTGLDNFAIGPVAGWSYEAQEFKTGKVRDNISPDTILSDLKYKMRWQGPWLGVDLTFDMDEVTIDAGYEYHWSNWHASYLLAGPDVLGVNFSDRRKSDNASGQLLYVDTRWTFCNGINAGIGLKYEDWKASGGRETPLAGSFVAVGLGGTAIDKIKHTSWESFSVTLDLGYTF